MLHWWGFSPGHRGKTAGRTNRARHSQGGRTRDRKTRQQKTRTKPLKKKYLIGQRSTPDRKDPVLPGLSCSEKPCFKVLPGKFRVLQVPMPENGSLGKLHDILQ